MSFLAPFFLAGAAAVALPLIFHLIRRSSRERVLFSSLMFLEPSPPRLTKRSRLEHLVLLALRALILCLLALAFARPFLPQATSAAPVQGERLRVAILVDSSASMRREDLWNQARTRAASLARSLKPEDALAVYTFDQQLRGVLSFADAQRLPAGDRAAAVESRLQSLSPSWAATHLGHALLNATEHLLEELNADPAEQGTTSLRLIVISDLQSGAKLDGLQGFEWPNKFDVQLEPVIARELFNASAQILEDSQRAFLAATNTTLRARIHNSPLARAEQLQLAWASPGGPLGDNVSAYVPPGQSRIVTLPPKPEQASALTLSGDAVDLDNVFHTATTATRPVTIAYWGGEPADDPREMRYYIHRAFEQTNLATRVLAVSNAVPPEASQAAFLIVGDPAPASLGLARQMLGEGRTVLIPLRGPADANLLSELLGGVFIAATESPIRNYALFGRISYQDPLFAPFADARFSDFSKIHFWKHRALNLANATNATVLATFDSGDPALASVPAGRGRLLVLATTWRPSDSQLALSSKFVPLLFGMLEQSAGLSSARQHFTVGETVTLPPSATNSVTLPDGTSVPVQGRTFSQTAMPGIYRAGEYSFAVNLDAAESRLAPLAREDLVSLGVPIGREVQPGDAAAAVERQRHLLATETESRQKIWRWFVIAAIAILLVESILAGRLSRTPAPA